MASPLYALEPLLLALGAGGAALSGAAPGLAVAAAVVVGIILAGYRHAVLSYPDGGGSYSASRTHLGCRGGELAAASAMIESALAVAVCLSAAAAVSTALIPAWANRPVVLAVVAVTALVLITGTTKASGKGWMAIAPVAYLICLVPMITIGLSRAGVGGDPPEVIPGGTSGAAAGESGVVLVALAAQVLVAWGVLLGGVDRVSASVPELPNPRARNATTTLVGGCLVAVGCLAGVGALARDGDNGPVVLAVAADVFGAGSAAYGAMAATAVAVLVAAAATVLRRIEGPVAVIAADDILPRSWASPVDPHGSRWPVLAVGVVAGILLWAFGGRTIDLVVTYAVAVFTTILVGQVAMVQRWRKVRAPSFDRAGCRRRRTGLTLTTVSAGVTTLMLVLALATGAGRGGWLAPLLTLMGSALMHRVRLHYAVVAHETAPRPRGVPQPGGVHGVVLVSHLDAGDLRALSYARAARLDSLLALALCSDADRQSADHLQEQWASRDIPVTLKVLDTSKDLAAPVMTYLEDARRLAPDHVFEVFIPWLVVDRWWQRLLHNEDGRTLRRRLGLMPGVMVTEVPLRFPLSGTDAETTSTRPTWNRGGHGVDGE